MTVAPHKQLVMFLSPSRSTRMVADNIVVTLRAAGHDVSTWDLSRHRSGPPLTPWALDSGAPLGLWLGSPVYLGHVLPDVLAALDRLPRSGPVWGAGFVTYGAVSSGMAFTELYTAFSQRGIVPVGLLKVVALHSQFYGESDALGKGRPNADDLAAVHAFVRAVGWRCTNGDPAPLAHEATKWQTARMLAAAQGKSLQDLRDHGPLPAVDKIICDTCGICQTVCPVGAISLVPWPSRAVSCIYCLECVKACPRAAFPFDFERTQAMLREFAAASDEVHQTTWFA